MKITYALNKKIIAVFAAVAFLLLPFLNTGFTIAQSDPSGGSGLRVSPTRTELTLINEESREVVHNIKNVTQSPVSVQISLNDFESDGITGQPLLIGNPDEVSANSMREFVVLPEDFDLQPDEEKEVKIQVSVPQDAIPGAYYGSVLYRASPLNATNDGQVALVASVGSLLLLEVPGDITEQIEITDISAYLGDSSGSIFTKKPDNIGILIKNLGNSFAKPFGKIAVTDWRDNEVFSYELNDIDRRKNVLPESSRVFFQELFNIEETIVNGQVVVEKTSPINTPGRYTVSGNISHGSTGEIFTVSATFWYLPLWFILLIVGFVLAVVLAGFYLYRKYVTPSTKRRR